ncbi:hypothetical protein B7494_g5321 [Chlorociboria aeruginascens]|nr:hypothetical protein B7494_g5321 [Chlorociboria aeruginascens]
MLIRAAIKYSPKPSTLPDICYRLNLHWTTRRSDPKQCPKFRTSYIRILGLCNECLEETLSRRDWAITEEEFDELEKAGEAEARYGGQFIPATATLIPSFLNRQNLESSWNTNLFLAQQIFKMAVEEQNPLLSTQHSSDSGLQVALHPLVLLTISDYITRHTLRQQKGPIVGALLGQQNGREITIEHAFECLLEDVDGQIILSEAWFDDRLQQMRDVHKAPALDLVGWYTTLSTSGPQPVHLPLHRQILSKYNESAILLGFHPTVVSEGSVGGKLPLTIYESNYEAEETHGHGGEDKEMEDGDALINLKFRELPYSVETGEAEMISVDFVARGGGNATAVDSAKKSSPIESSTKKGKSRAPTKSEENAQAEQNCLSTADEELIASLTAKANSIKMLHSRINLIATYLQKLPPSFVSDTEPSEAEPESTKYAPVNHSILRSIQALLSRLSLVIPADSAAFEKELLSEKNDVNLVSLLSSITQSIKEIRDVGKKFQVVDTAKSLAKPNGGGDINKHWNGNQIANMLNVGDLAA